MKCIHCQGTMNRATAPFHVDRHGYHLLLDTVPAWVCDLRPATNVENRSLRTEPSRLFKRRLAPSTNKRSSFLRRDEETQLGVQRTRYARR